jgi:hypothetical protein
LDTIQKSNGHSAFEFTRGNRYDWQFETATRSDTQPPTIESIYPSHLDSIPRNTIIQIVFSEPMDPTTVQGQGNTFTNILFAATGVNPSGILPSGEWQSSNGYRTVEFVPSEQCGQNSCGEVMHCLQIPCVNPNDPTCVANYSLLVRAARTLPGVEKTDFTAIPFSGVMDLAGNALDTSPESSRDRRTGILPGDGTHNDALNRPNVPSVQIFSPSERADDNFWWDFTVHNVIDRQAPYISAVTPTVDEQSVDSMAPVTITFSKRMWTNTLSDIAIEEFPQPTTTDPLWYSIRTSQELANNNTLISKASVRHRMFGPNDSQTYYFPSVPSSVKSLQQNCLYPGRGPAAGNGDRSCTVTRNDRGEQTISDCMPTTDVFNEDTDTACMQTTVLTDNGQNMQLQPSVAACIAVLKRPDVSPTLAP